MSTSARRSRATRSWSVSPSTAPCTCSATITPRGRGAPVPPCGAARSGTCAACCAAPDARRNRVATGRPGRGSGRRRVGGAPRSRRRGGGGEALHTLGDAPPVSAGSRVPLHRALHVARLGLLVLGAVATANAVQWWAQPWGKGLVALVVGVLLLFVVGDALPRSIARLAPELSDAALP